MLKKILNWINDVLFIIAYASITTFAVIGLVPLGVYAIVLIATCSLILHIGVTRTLKRMEMEDEN